MSPLETLGFALGTSFASGLNLYATVAAAGLFQRFGIIQLPDSLQVLASPFVLGIAILLFVIEFVADKIPMFDLVWNALQTFVRVPVGALLAYSATNGLSPTWQLAAAAVGGGIAFAAHGGKTAARAAVTPSPEPVSNFVLSVGEDAFAIFITWFATQHPYLAAIIVVILLVIIVVLVRWIVGAIRSMMRSAAQRWDRLAVKA